MCKMAQDVVDDCVLAGTNTVTLNLQTVVNMVAFTLKRKGTIPADADVKLTSDTGTEFVFDIIRRSKRED